MINHYYPLGETPTWTGQIELKDERDPADVQKAVTACVAEHDITIVGLYAAAQGLLSLHTWHESRPEYKPTPGPKESQRAMRELAGALDACSHHATTLHWNMMQVLMGRKIGGYDDGPIADIGALRHIGWDVLEGHMVSARALTDGSVEPYGEPAGRIRAPRTPENLSALGRIAHDLRQSHFAVEGVTTGKTVLYEHDSLAP